MNNIIIDVWGSNLIKEMRVLSDIIEDGSIVGMDTEFPGVVSRPAKNYSSVEEMEYDSMRCNVDLLKIIQLGISVYSKNFSGSPQRITWQFNFKFNQKKDCILGSALNILEKSDIDFERFNTDGIDVYDFSIAIFTSGLIMNPKITWVVFHGLYDFGYLLKVLTAKPLPRTLNGFHELLKTYFPTFYDIKYYTAINNYLPDSLQRLTVYFKLSRFGKEHQAGSDALATLDVFNALKFGEDRKLDDIYEKTKNKLFGVSPLVEI